jgi:hypothetical protein
MSLACSRRKRETGLGEGPPARQTRAFDLPHYRRRAATGRILLCCLTLVSFVLGYAWAAGWVGEMWAVEASVTHCLLGAGTLGASAALGAWMLS